MAIVKMKKLALAGLISDEQAVVQTLHRMSLVEITDVKEQLSDEQQSIIDMQQVQDKLEQLDNDISKMKYTLDFLERFVPDKKGMFTGKPLVKADDYKTAVQKLNELIRIYETCRDFDEELTSIKGQRMRINNAIGQMSPWVALDTPLSEVRDTRFVRLVLGTMPVVLLDGFKKAVEENGIGCYIHNISQDRNTAYLFMAFHKNDQEILEPILRQYEWNDADLSEYSLKPAQHIEQWQQELAELERSENEVIGQATELKEHRPDLKLANDYLMIQRQRAEVLSDFAATRQTFILTGWVPAERADELQMRVSSVTDAYWLDLKDPVEGEPFPVAFKNSKLVKPFEMLTEMYSMPHPYSLDPTPAVAPFYFIFFGMMMGDAAYGILISIAFFAAMHFMRTKGMGQKLIMLLALCGISTIFWGAMFGSWFGDLFHIKPLWFNPMEQPMLMMVVSLILGVIHILVGIGLKAYMNVKDGHVADAIFDQLSWMMVLGGASLWLAPLLSDMLLSTPAPQLAGAAQIGLYIAIAGIVVLLLTQGRSQKNLFMKVFSGVGSLYNITGFLSDILSYSRLFALGLASGMIATVINILAGLVGMSGINLIISIPILILGHIFNLAINGLGAYVHSSRLQYIEFFGKFFESGGKAFRPFHIETKYTDIENEEAV
ncbi:MAG: V/A-type H+/Na+-transporting ATPase subunit [Clostridiales bacterium]|nr:V/A-type H+/Na+-transporting ATPase subunit [Clostridiales bacterium]